MDYWFKNILNFAFLENSLGKVSPPHFVYDFSIKMFLMLYSIDRLISIACFSLRLEILGDMCIANVTSEVLKSTWSWNYNARNNISFSVSKIYFVYLMARVDLTNHQNFVRGVIWGYIYTININIRIKDNTWNVIIVTIKQYKFAKLGRQRFAVIKKGMYSLVNDENY